MLNLKVPEMTCGHCASTVEKAVKGVDPKAKVTIDLGASTVSVEGARDEEAVSAAILQAGYANEKLGVTCCGSCH